jgi:hypothetical protein
MPIYVVATRQEAQMGSLTAEDHVREVSGVWIRRGTDPNRITIEASELAATEIERRFGSVLLIEPEIVASAEQSADVRAYDEAERRIGSVLLIEPEIAVDAVGQDTQSASKS